MQLPFAGVRSRIRPLRRVLSLEEPRKVELEAVLEALPELRALNLSQETLVFEVTVDDDSGDGTWLMYIGQQFLKASRDPDDFFIYKRVGQEAQGDSSEQSQIVTLQPVDESVVAPA